MRKTSFSRGFSVIEMAATLMIVALLAVFLLPLSNFLLNRRQTEITTDRMQELRRALNGNPTIVFNEARTSFGYIGDMGSLPAKLEDLWIKGSQLPFTFNNTLKTGAGWNGPYLEVTLAEYAPALGFDAWGNAFSYSRAPFTDATFGAPALGKLLTLGADQTDGTVDDIVLNLFKAETVSRVQGFVRDLDGVAIAGVNVTINYPSNGALISQTDPTDSTGYYSFDEIAFGNRSLTVEPRLVLAPSTSLVTGTSFQNVEFVIKNFAATNISISSITFSYSVTPAAYFRTLKVGGKSVYTSTNPRLGSGNTVMFTAETITGSNGVKESFPIRIQSPVTDVADLIVGLAGKGGSLKIEMEDFEDVTSGNGNYVDMTGVPFEITFSDGSVVFVTPVVPAP